VCNGEKEGKLILLVYCNRVIMPALLLSTFLINKIVKILKKTLKLVSFKTLVKR